MKLLSHTLRDEAQKDLAKVFRANVLFLLPSQHALNPNIESPYRTIELNENLYAADKATRIAWSDINRNDNHLSLEACYFQTLLLLSVHYHVWNLGSRVEDIELVIRAELCL